MQYAAKVYLLRALDDADAVNMRRAIFKHKEVTVKRRKTSKESDKESEPESLRVGRGTVQHVATKIDESDLVGATPRLAGV